MNYRAVLLENIIEIREIITVHYYEYRNDFCFLGEKHNFWEFLYVDKGEIGVMADERHYQLKKGEIIFHKPEEFHTVEADGRVAPNLIVIAFCCDSPAMTFFEDKILCISDDERKLLAIILKEAEKAFSSRLDDPWLESLSRREQAAVGCEQLLRINLEQLLICLLRRYMEKEVKPLPGILPKERNNRQIYEDTIAYMEKQLREKLTIEKICRDNLVGRAQLQKLFREYSDAGIMEHFSFMKIDMAKQMIRERYDNFSQIADYLGYGSVHYFSRQFKKLTGMTPSEYASSVKILSEEALTRYEGKEGI